MIRCKDTPVEFPFHEYERQSIYYYQVSPCYRLAKDRNLNITETFLCRGHLGLTKRCCNYRYLFFRIVVITMLLLPNASLTQILRRRSAMNKTLALANINISTR